VSATCRPAGVAALPFSSPSGGKSLVSSYTSLMKRSLLYFTKCLTFTAGGSEETVAGWLMVPEGLVVLPQGKTILGQGGKILKFLQGHHELG
jgi:hypothetical protein